MSLSRWLAIIAIAGVGVVIGRRIERRIERERDRYMIRRLKTGIDEPN